MYSDTCAEVPDPKCAEGIAVAVVTTNHAVAFVTSHNSVRSVQLHTQQLGAQIVSAESLRRVSEIWGGVVRGDAWRIPPQRECQLVTNRSPQKGRLCVAEAVVEVDFRRWRSSKMDGIDS